MKNQWNFISDPALELRKKYCFVKKKKKQTDNNF